jgi:hypothetical protein
MSTDTDVDVFLDALAHELRLRGYPALRSELRYFVHDSWPLIQDDPSPAAWASRYLEQHPWQPAAAE